MMDVLTTVANVTDLIIINSTYGGGVGGGFNITAVTTEVSPTTAGDASAYNATATARMTSSLSHVNYTHYLDAQTTSEDLSSDIDNITATIAVQTSAYVRPTKAAASATARGGKDTRMQQMGGYPITYLSDHAAKSTPPRLHGLVKQADLVSAVDSTVAVSPGGGRSRRLSKGHMAAVVVSSVCLFVIVAILWIYCRKPFRYQKILADDSAKFEYIYKPTSGGGLDEEYENTFVGVSIPLLQDNTKV